MRRRIDVVVCSARTQGRIPAHLVIRDPSATIGDLAAQLGAGPSWLAVDGQPCGPTTTITDSGIYRGSLVATPPGASDPPDEPPHGPYLVTETGLDSARFFPLELGEVTAGRDERHGISLPLDRAASRDHCRFDVAADGSVTVTDLGSTNGTLLNDVPLTRSAVLERGDRLRVGSTVLAFGVGSATDGSPGPRPLDVFHRPPRRHIPEPPAAVAVPDPPDVREQKPVVPIVALITPIAFAVVMIYFLRSFIYASFGLLGPLAAGGTYLDGKRRYRKAKRGVTRSSRIALDRLADDLEHQRQLTLETVRRTAGPLGRLRVGASLATPGLWERRTDHADFLEVRLATGHLPYVPRLQTRSTPNDATQEIIDKVAARGLDVASLRLGESWVGIWGYRPAALAVARALLLQAATTSGPVDLAVRLAVGPHRQLDWEWAQWLPHAADGADGSDAVHTETHPMPGSGRARSRVVLWLLDEPVEERDHSAVAGLAVAPDFNRLPDQCHTVVHLERDGVLSVEYLRERRVLDGLLASGVSGDVADVWARRLARHRDDEVPVGRLPESVNGMDLWGAEPGRTGLVWPIGEDRHGPVHIDLNGPDHHVVIAGTPGSGRTEAIEGVVAAFARYGPGVVNVAVLDLAGGNLRGRLGAFPHVCGVASELDSATSAEGPLARLEGEILRRDRLIRAGGFDSLDAYRDAEGEDVAHLVVVVDDPGTLSAQSQATLEALVRLVAGSAHLGVHAVLATTQPAGRPATVLEAAAVHVALRLDQRSSEAFVGVPYPARLPRSRPGRAWMRVGDHPARAIQIASASAPAPPDVPVEVHLAVTGTAPGVSPNDGRPSVLDAIMERAQQRFPGRVRPLWGEAGAVARGQPPPASLASLLGVSDLGKVDFESLWSREPSPDALSAPIGTDPFGNPVGLDLKEAAFGGMGPHGLVVGATGSGKSELLRTLVCALAARHPPELLSLVLVDFKGGATFAGFADLPHVAGLITNLQADLSNVDRMEAALVGEQQRRQELLRQAGNLGSAEAYRQLRHSHPELAPLPDLLVIVDEFAELLEQRPEFITMFGSLGRLGRSLGIHLLLATQRLDEGRLRGLESHLRFRISLRTNSVTESRSVLGLPDAAMLPSEPGVGYLRVDDPKLVRFRAALVSASPASPRDDGSTGSDLELITARLRQAAPRTHQIWLPVLPRTLELGRLLGRVGVVPGRGLQALDWTEPGSQRAPLGVIDRPRLQTRAALVTDFSGATGHLAIVGSPRSGKTSVLRTVAASLALTHTPEEINIYGVDFAGGGLLTLSGLPHVGGVAHQADEELVARTVSHVIRAVEQREQLFLDLGIHSVEDFRRRRAEGRLPPGHHGDIYLIVDGWDNLRSVSEALEDRLSALARRGLAVGAHLVVAASRWPMLRPGTRDSILGRLELRQSDPFESLFDRRAAENVPVDAPGRGITDSGEHFLAALATPGGHADPESGWEELVAAIREAWVGPAAPPVLVLPTKVSPEELARPARGVAVGLAEPDLTTLALDPLGPDQHILVLGDGMSGKTTFLRTFLGQLTAGRKPKDVRLLIADPRRGLMDAVDPQLRFGYAGSVPAVGPEVARLRDALDGRLPGPDVTVEQLRHRSWWQGPEVYLVVDDHDVVVTPAANPLLPVLDLLAQAADVGLHLVLARRVAGWQRAQYEPVVQRMREVGATMVVMSGDPAEGLITGSVRAATRAPGRVVVARYRASPFAAQVAC